MGERMLDEHRIACMSLTIISTLANGLATIYVGGWSEHWAHIVTAANLTSYAYQLLSALVTMRRRVLSKRVGEMENIG